MNLNPTPPAFSKAQMRRFLQSEKYKHPDCPANLWQRYQLFIECVWGMENGPEIKTLKEWLNS